MIEQLLLCDIRSEMHRFVGGKTLDLQSAMAIMRVFTSDNLGSFERYNNLSIILLLKLKVQLNRIPQEKT
jgi:hypothetical protein